MITEQQPSSSCEGINNLINFSSTVEICRAEKCEILICSTNNWTLSLLFRACNRESVFNVTDRTRGDSVSATIPSGSELHEVNHTLGNNDGNIQLISRVVTSGQNEYFVVSLEAPLFNISIPMTAIPVECRRHGMALLQFFSMYYHIITKIQAFQFQ